MRLIRLVLFATTLVIPAPVSAQTTQTAAEFGPDGAYLTAPVREAVAKARADEFLKTADTLQFSPRETKLVTEGLRTRTLKAPSNYEFAGLHGGTFETPEGRVDANAEQRQSIQKTMLFVPKATFFQKYAVIHVGVIPAPPRDYKVVINGEECPATDVSTYKVLPGKATVAVSRSGKTPCTWTGSVSSAKQEEVQCKL